jgi:hypothetical protein
MMKMPEIATPLRSELQSLTVEINETGVDPFEAYELLCRRLGNLGLWFDTYCSSSITSGGHARNDSLNMGEVIRKNTDSAHDLCDELFRVGQLDPQSTIEAVAVGKISNWAQSDYMEFWLNVMARPRHDGAGVARRLDELRNDFTRAIEQNDDIDMATYNNPAFSAEERAPQYIKHADIYTDVIQGTEHAPISRLVRLIDADTSLGAQTENYFAKVMGISVMNVAVAQVGNQRLPAHYPAPRLVNDTDEIVRYGGRVFHTKQRTQLVLVPAE